MKKTLIGIAAALAGMMVLASQELTPLRFKTTEPATYADGEPVCSGELVALVWVKDAETPVNFRADGSLDADAETAKLLMAISSVGADGKVAWTQFDPPAEYRKSGELRFIILDTRNASGTLNDISDKLVDGWVALNDGVLPVAVNGFDVVTNYTAGGESQSFKFGGAVEVASVSALPPDAPQAEIVATRFEGEGKDRKMVLTVKNTAWYAKYNAAKGTTPDAIGTEKAAVKPVDGKTSPVETIDIAVPAPANEDKAFIKVIRN